MGEEEPGEGIGKNHRRSQGLATLLVEEETGRRSDRVVLLEEARRSNHQGGVVDAESFTRKQVG